MTISSSFSRGVFVWGVVGLLALFAWEVIGHTTTGRLLVSRPALLVEYAGNNGDQILRSAAYTAAEATLGLGIAIIFSLAFGLICIYAPRVASTAHPILVGSQTIPFICIAPLVILSFGPGVSGKVFLSFLMCFFPLVTNIVTGVRRVPRAHLELLTMMNAPRSFVIRNVYLVFGLPFIFAGLRVAAPFCVVGAIVAEFNGAEWGLGKDMFIAAKRLEPELMMLGLTCAILLSAALYGFVLIIESTSGIWYREGKTQ
jgi:NitT/TauT family transport system permease protein